MRVLREIRAPIPADDHCEEPRNLVQEIAIPSVGEARSLVTVHRSEKCWTDRLVLWRRDGAGYRALSVFDEGSASAGLIRYNGREFLVLGQSQPSATHYWDGHMLLAVTGEGGLHVVPFSGWTKCGKRLPPLSDRFEHSYGGFYTFNDDDIRFEWNVWSPGDPPNFPSGGLMTGTLTMVESAESESGLRLVVEDCRLWTTEEADEREDPPGEG